MPFDSLWRSSKRYCIQQTFLLYHLNSSVHDLKHIIFPFFRISLNIFTNFIVSYAQSGVLHVSLLKYKQNSLSTIIVNVLLYNLIVSFFRLAICLGFLWFYDHGYNKYDPLRSFYPKLPLFISTVLLQSLFLTPLASAFFIYI